MAHARGAPNAGHFYSNIVNPIKVDIQFQVSSTDSGGFGIKSLKSNGYVQSVFMNTSATPATGNPNPAAGYCLIHMKQNFNHFLGMNYVAEPPVTGAAINISDSSVLTEGVAYQIVTVGSVPDAAFTVDTVADSSKSLAGTYFKASDAFGNNYVFYNVVSGSGTPPSLTGSLANYTAIPVTFATNALDSAVATSLATAMDAVNGGNSWDASASSNTVTVTSKVDNVGLVPPPVDVNTGFTISDVDFTSLSEDWQSIGLPAGFTPSVGQAFIATATGSALGDGTVKALTDSAIITAEVLGVSDALIANNNIAVNGGAWVMIAFRDTDSALVAPTAGSIVSLSLWFDQGSVTIDGL